MSKNTIKTIAKYTAKIAVSSGTSKIIHDVIDANVVAETRLDKAQIWIGSIAISLLVSDAAWNHLEDMVTEVADNADAAKEIHETEAVTGEVVE